MNIWNNMRSSLSTCFNLEPCQSLSRCFDIVYIKIQIMIWWFICMLNSNFCGSQLYCSWWRMVWEYHCFLVIWILICVWNYSHVCTFFILGPLRIWKLLDGGGGSSTSNLFSIHILCTCGGSSMSTFCNLKTFLVY